MTTADILWGLGFIAAGLRLAYRRHRIASNATRGYEAWMANRPDVDLLGTRLGVLGWILVAMGVAMLILHPLSR